MSDRHRSLRGAGSRQAFPRHARPVIRARPIGLVRAVDDVTFEIARGETLALVGESGCGKSTTGRLVLRLMDPTAGSVRFKGKEIAGPRQAVAAPHAPPHADHLPGPLRLAQSAHDRGRDPGRADGRARRIAEGRSARSACASCWHVVGLLPEHAQRYPHQFSGGQRQRIGIARALAVNPDLIVCDEPVSALDVSIQAQIVNLLQNLQQPLRPLLPLHRPRPRRGEAHQRPRGGDVSRQAGRDRRQARRSTPSRCIPTPRRCCRRSRAPTRRCATQPHAAGGRRAEPASTRRPAAASTRAAPSPRTRCRKEEPLLREAGTGHRVACHFFETLPAPTIAAADGPADRQVRRTAGRVRERRSRRGPRRRHCSAAARVMYSFGVS